MPADNLHTRVSSLEQRLTAAEHEQLLLRSISRRVQRIDLNLRMLLRHLKIMGASDVEIDKANARDER